jgi:hypothetical protein
MAAVAAFPPKKERRYAFDAVVLVQVVTLLGSDHDQARADAERAEDAIERLGAAGSQNVRQAGPQADANRERRLPPRPPSCARPASRSRCERSSHHGVEKRNAAHPHRRLKRKNDGFWRSQFCTEVARPTRFELVTSAFGGQRPAFKERKAIVSWAQRGMRMAVKRWVH